MTEINASTYWAGKKVVVLGGFGFLGQHISAALANRGAIPIRLSRRADCHVDRRGSLFYFLGSMRPDAVINVAAMQGGIAFQKTNPFAILDTNLTMAGNATAAAIATSGQLINVISSCAYPEMSAPMREDKLFSADVSESAPWYAEAKRASVRYTEAAVAEFGFDARSVILPNLYGPGDHFESTRSHALAALVRKFYEAERDGAERVEVWGTGSPVREWMYAGDAADGILNYGEIDTAPKRMNIGTGVGFSINELAHLIREVSGCDANIVYNTEKGDGPMVKVMNVALMRKTMAWRPRMDLSQGIKITLDWLKQNYDVLSQAGAF